MIAINTIRPDPHYRRQAFDKGLQTLGYEMRSAGKPRAKTDLLLLWNLHGSNEDRARDWENNGGTVLVCENGYCGKDAAGLQLYAISVHAHNGAGWFPVGEDDRFAELGIDLQPWRTGGKHILVCGQRGIGSRQMASPHNWDDKAFQRLREDRSADVRIRRHPGNRPSPTTLDQDLEGARLCVIWSSASGVRALTLGIPVVYCAPHWICEGAAGHSLGMVNEPICDDEKRLAAMRRMAHAQWRVAEIESGEPFRRILANLGAAKW